MTSVSVPMIPTPVTVETELGGPRPLLRLAAWAGRGVGEVCQRCVEYAVSRYVKTVVLAAAVWPVLPEIIRVWAVSGALVMVGTAIAVTGRRQSLLRVRGEIRYRHRVRRVKRRWKRAVGRNAAMRQKHHAADGVGAPFKDPARVDMPLLLAGFRAWKRVEGQLLPAYFGPRRTPYGVVVTADGSPTGHVLPAFAAEAAIIGGSLRAKAAFCSEAVKLPSLIRISLLYADPFAQTIPRSLLPAPSAPGMVPTGFDQDGDVVEKSLWLPHLSVGESGSGKSSETHTVIAGIVDMDVPLRLWVFDPKGGVEFECYENTAYRYVRSPYKYVDLLRELIGVMQDKLNRLRGYGRQAPMEDPDFGLDVFVIDELLSTINFIDDADKRNRIRVTVEGESRDMKPSEAANHLLSQQRAAAIVTLANSQMGQKDKLPNRDMYPNITCFRVGFDETVTMLGFSAKEHPAHLIPPGPEYSGIGFTRTTQGIVKYRAAFMPDTERAAVAARVAKWTQFYRAREHA